KHLKDNGITAPFHYLSLHKSDYYHDHTTNIPDLPYCDMYADCLVRLPMFFELSDEEVEKVINTIASYYNAK
ncbi:MAG: DegT/DnrJ/EryC1/StrS family aminotransferase, partial [Bacteroidales bacterium]|nr:DegT/DnrJ/EryC1/StrS family aminotransferase [Bacteroidales bacterium]